ncbi:MAG: peptidase [Candidatus Doudnabacteria bacterium]|nr:peptidase [Candidatus Doudnabacteria bacterium]
MKRYILTSTGLSDPKLNKEIAKLLETDPKEKAVIITTAAEEKDHSKYVQVAKEQLIKLGYKTVLFVDFENEGLEKIIDADLIYVAGGNTFKLMKFARMRKFGSLLRLDLSSTKTYIGVSAGSIILGNSVEIAGALGGDYRDSNEVELKDLTAIRLVMRDIYPHYTPDQEQETQKYEEQKNIEVLRIADDQAMLYDSNGLTYLE